MEYYITFEDGDSAYLTHSGVKGMKWGVWNEETKARRAGRRTEKATQRMLKDEQKMLGAAYREINRPGMMSTYELNRAANKYVASKAKVAELNKKNGVPDDPYGIRKQERAAGKYLRNLSIAGGLGGAIGGGTYALASRNGANAKAYEAVRHRAIRDAREQAKYGSEQVSKLLEAQKQGSVKVVGAHFDGKGNNTYLIKPIGNKQ